MLLILGSVLSVCAAAVQAQTPPGTVIRNGATVTYQAATGATFAPVSDSAFVTVGSPSGIVITLNKAVDLATGTLGDVLTYTIQFQGLGSGTATSVVVTDPLPAGASYVAGSITLDGTPLSDQTGDDAGAFNAASRRVTVTLPDVTGSSSGVITFRARLDGTASPSNVAHVAYTTPSGPDSAASNPAVTTLVFSESISLAVLLDAPAAGVPARTGDTVQYRVHYDNPANGVVARNVIVTDTLPPGLQYVGSIPASTMAFPAPKVVGDVHTWTIGDIAPGTSGDLVIKTVVAPTLPDSVTVVNRVWVNLDNGPAITSPAPAILLLPAVGQLTLAQTADVLEVGVGQTVPYTLALNNLGVVPLADFRIVAHLPDGARYTPHSAIGADSVNVNGQDATFYVAGPLAAGATFNVRYQVAIVSAASDLLQSSAVAYAEGGTVTSPQATAWVRVQHAYPLETRAVVGKVFVDANANGKQDPGEPGAQGVDVWTDDGEIATTDSVGRFSFANVRPGRHAYRVDPTTLPAGFRASDPAQARDGSGWTTPRVDFALAPAAGGAGGAGGAGPADTAAISTTFISLGPFVPALRDSAARAGEERRALTAGPAVTFFAPRDGAILPTDRVFVGVHGEPGAVVVLFDGATRIADGRIRGDGINDFIAVPLATGPHRLRVMMQNSWAQDRWDSLNVHVVGRPANFVYEGKKVILTVDGQRVDTVFVHVFDQWNVPVVTGALVTISADGAEVVNADADGSSVGVQVRADSTGVLALALRGGHDVRIGSLALRADGATAQLQLEILPAARPFMLTAAGQVGVGASPDAFGAATARGRLDARTSVLVSVDSRQLDAGSENFGRAVDPLGEAQYPILGDASITGTQSASRYAVAARVERGLDWLAFGDLGTGAFAGGLTLSGYDRALTGVAGRVTTGRGAIVLQGFGSTTSERLAQQQIRGAGMSGPYDVGLGIKPGTERVVLETRAYDDAQQTLAREALSRFVDYQIDYDRGLLLFKQPVPAADASGNPVFIMITYGSADGAESTVWGLRATADARGLVKNGHESLDSLRIGWTIIHDGRPGAERNLAGFDFGALRVGRVALHGELAHSQTPDSAGFATSLGGSIALSKGVTVSGNWLHTDPEFHNPANLALAGGSNDLKLAARFQMGGTELRFEHSAQSFDLQNVSRTKSGAYVVQRLGTDFKAQVGLSGSRLDTGTGVDDAQASELRLIWSPLKRLDFTADARRHLGDVASVVQPDYIGAGVTFKASAQTSFELTHRHVEIPGGSGYAVTSLGGRSELGMGTRAWGSYQMAGANGGQVAAVVGLNNRLQLGPAWTLNTLFERRFGLNDAPNADPIRALPFTQVEENYWSAGFGAEYLPEQARYRLSLRSELRDGEQRSSRLLTLAGAADLSNAFAVITRQEFQGMDDRQPTGGGRLNHQRLSSLNGLAFRPVGSDALNFLAKVQVIDEQNPLGGGVLTGQAGHEARRIYMAEAIWSPSSWFELGGRYAFRNADATVTHADSVVQPLRSSADYVGARLDVALRPWLRARGDSRLLRERTTGTSQWDAAPQLVLVPVHGIEIANGYRFGDLRDPDFSVRGGAGWFMTIGATITEQSMSTIANFWRSRQ